MVPKEIAQRTDVLGTSVWYFHTQLESQIDTRAELLPDYRTRELTLYNKTIAGYVDDDMNQLFTREGGNFCIFGGILEQLCIEKGLNFDIPKYVSVLKNKYREREILLK